MANFPRCHRRARRSHACHHFAGRLATAINENARVGVGPGQQQRGLNQLLEQLHRLASAACTGTLGERGASEYDRSKLPQNVAFLKAFFLEFFRFAACAPSCRAAAAAAAAALDVEETCAHSLQLLVKRGHPTLTAE